MEDWSGDACRLGELVDWLNIGGKGTCKAALKKWVGLSHVPTGFCVVPSSLISIFWTPFAFCSSACLAGDAGQWVVAGRQKRTEASMGRTKPARSLPSLKTSQKAWDARSWSCRSSFNLQEMSDSGTPDIPPWYETHGSVSQGSAGGFQMKST